MNAILHKMNLLKKIFRKYRSLDSIIDESQFNFFKWHIMSHYLDFIKEFDTSNEYSTQSFEKAHLDLMKNYYVKINKRENFDEQLMNHNVRHINMITMTNIIAYRESDSLSNSVDVVKDTANKIERLLNLNELDWQFDSKENKRLKQLHELEVKHWRIAKIVAR